MVHQKEVINKEIVLNSLINGITQLDEISTEQKKVILNGLKLLVTEDLTDEDIYKWESNCYDAYFLTSLIGDSIKVLNKNIL